MTLGSAKDIQAEGTKHTVQSVDRAVQLLSMLSQSTDGLGLIELSSALGIHKSTVHRLLASLQGAGIVDRAPESGRYHLGLELIALAGTVLGRLEVVRLADPHLRRLANETNETVNLAIRHGDEVLNVEQIPGSRVLRSFDWIGKRSPLHLGAAAKALLANLSCEDVEAYIQRVISSKGDFNQVHLRNELRDIQDRGAAINTGELDPDVVAVGAPVFNASGSPCASISVAGFREDFDDAKVEDLTARVIDVGLTLSRQMGYQSSRVARMA